VDELTERIDDIKTQQGFAFTREQIHRDIAEFTNQRVLYWTIAEVAVLTLLSLAQVMYLKNFFELRVAV